MAEPVEGSSEDAVERFSPTSGRAPGTVALLLVAAVVVTSVVDPVRGFPPPVVAAALLVGVLVWAAMLRPRVWVTRRSLVLRNMLHTVTIPLASIEEVAVRQVLAVRAGERRYTSPAVGRTWRQVARSPEAAASGRRGSTRSSRPVTPSYPDFVEERIRGLVAEAAEAEGVRRWSEEQAARAADVRREPAWLEIGLLVAATVGLVVTLLV